MVVVVEVVLVVVMVAVVVVMFSSEAITPYLVFRIDSAAAMTK